MPRDYVQIAADLTTIQLQITALQNFVNVVAAPVTWTDFSNANLWVPVYGDPTFATIAIASTGVTITSVNLGNGVLGPTYYGVISRGRFFPGITGVLDVRVNYDTYFPATDGIGTRFYRTIMLFCSENGINDQDNYPSKGIAYGCLPAAGKETADVVGATMSGTTNVVSVFNLSGGNQNAIADNSNFFMRFKTTTGVRNANNHGVWISYGEFNANGGGTVYGGAIAAASWKDYGQSRQMMGARLFVGTDQETNSARFRVRVVGVTLNQGSFVLA